MINNIKNFSWIITLCCLISIFKYFNLHEINLFLIGIFSLLVLPTIFFIFFYVLKKNKKFEIYTIEHLLKLPKTELIIVIITSFIIYYTKCFAIFLIWHLFATLNFIIHILLELYVEKKEYISCDYSSYINNPYITIYDIIYYYIIILPKFTAFFTIYFTKNKNEKKNLQLWELFFNGIFNRTIMPIVILKISYNIIIPIFNTIDVVMWSKKNPKKWLYIFCYTYIKEFKLLFQKNNYILIETSNYKIYKNKVNGLPIYRQTEPFIKAVTLHTDKYKHSGCLIQNKDQINSVFSIYTKNPQLPELSPNMNLFVQKIVNKSNNIQCGIVVYEKDAIWKYGFTNAFKKHNLISDQSAPFLGNLFFTQLAISNWENQFGILYNNNTPKYILLSEIFKKEKIGNHTIEDVLIIIKEGSLDYLKDSFPGLNSYQIREELMKSIQEVCNLNDFSTRMTYINEKSKNYKTFELLNDQLNGLEKTLISQEDDIWNNL